MKRSTMFACLSLLFGSVAGAQESALARAERAYRLGQFEPAAKLYEEALADAGEHRGAVLYDLGTCALQLGRLPEAVHRLRSAQLRLPDDASVKTNLALAEKRLGLAGEPPTPAPGSATMWFVAASLVQCLGVVAFLFVRAANGRRAGLVVAFVGLGIAAVGVRSHWTMPAPAGVALAGAPVHGSPAIDAPVAFRLEPGQSVRVVERGDGWLRVERSGGKGWVSAEAVGVVE